MTKVKQESQGLNKKTNLHHYLVRMTRIWCYVPPCMECYFRLTLIRQVITLTNAMNVRYFLTQLLLTCNLSSMWALQYFRRCFKDVYFVYIATRIRLLCLKNINYFILYILFGFWALTALRRIQRLSGIQLIAFYRWWWWWGVTLFTISKEVNTELFTFQGEWEQGLRAMDQAVKDMPRTYHRL